MPVLVTLTALAAPLLLTSLVCTPIVCAGATQPTQSTRVAETALRIDQPKARRLLGRISRPVLLTDARLPPLLAGMRRVTEAHHAGGLAAVQVGVPLRVLLLRTPSRDYEVLINPRVLWRSRQRISSWEYCLSVPWGYRMTERAARMRINYQTASGKQVEAVFMGDAAVVLQHELDHLDGRHLGSHFSKSWFIPSEAIASVARRAEIRCQGVAENHCRKQMRRVWLSYVRRQKR